ncbi:MAG: UPF0175 family protein [Deltaproteobacteria bacterium]|nr:UPF0175 family protein [Deltaproteobacteria bacterium]
MTTLHLTIPDALAGQLKDPAPVLERMALEAFLVRLYAQGLVSSGQAGKTLGMARVDFLDLVGRHGVTVFDSDVDFDAEAAVLDAACGPLK